MSKNTPTRATSPTNATYATYATNCKLFKFFSWHMIRMAESFEDYAKKHLIGTIDFNDFMTKPEYGLSKKVMRLEYESSIKDDES